MKLRFEEMTAHEQRREVAEWNQEAESFISDVESREQERAFREVEVPGWLADKSTESAKSSKASMEREGLLATATATPIYVINLRKGALLAVALEYDNGGNTFQGWVFNSPYEHPDVQSVVYWQRINSAGQITSELTVKCAVVNGVNHKADSSTGRLADAGTSADLDIRISAHALKEEPRDVSIQRYLWRGVGVPFPAGVRPVGGHGIFKGVTEPEPPPPGGGEPVDYARIETIMDFVSDTNTEDDIITAVNNNLIPKTIAALAYLTDTRAKRLDDGGETWQGQPIWLNDTTRALISHYQAGLFGFTKNAAANPLRNILAGEDAWGIARRKELKAIIREVLAEPPTAPEKNPVT